MSGLYSCTAQEKVFEVFTANLAKKNTTLICAHRYTV